MNMKELTFSDLAMRFRTGRAVLISGKNREKKYEYRHGVMTNIGDIEASEWEKLMVDLIKREGEMGLFEQLKRYAQDHCTFLRSGAEIERYALELYSFRMFDNKNWAGYEEFNRLYRACAV